MMNPGKLARFLAVFSVGICARAAAAGASSEDVGRPLFRGVAAAAATHSKNVYGDPLAPCSAPGMAKTGFDRSGQCVDQADDSGSHHICIDLSSASSNGEDFCQVTGQPDWCAEDMPCHEDASEKCPVKDWCVCQWAFEGYLAKAGGCDAIQEIECEAVNVKAVEAYEADVEKHGDALACLRDRCGLKKDEDRAVVSIA